MPVTETEIQSLMRECGVTPGPKLGTKMVSVVESLGKKLLFTVGVTGNVMVQFRSLEMISAPSARYRSELHTALMSINYEVKLVKFSFDESDGEVVAYIDLFVGEGSLTKKQVQRCINTLRNVVIPTWIRLEKLIETGTDPGDSGGTEQIRELLLEMLASGAAAESAKSTPAPNGKQPKSKKGDFGGLLDDVLDKD